MGGGFNIVFTTSRGPSRRVRSFCRELGASIAYAVKMNRGKRSMEEAALEALRLGASRMAIVYSFKGNPSRIDFYELSPQGYRKLSLTLLLGGVRLLREASKEGLKPKRRLSRSLIAYPSNADEDVKKLCLNLSYALNLPASFINGWEASLAKDYDSILIVDKGRGELAIMKIIDPSTRKDVGPFIKIRKVAYIPRRESPRHLWMG